MMRGRGPWRRLLAALACFAGLASPTVSVLHGLAHARAYAGQVGRPTGDQVGVTTTAARPHAAARAAVDRAALPQPVRSLDARDHDDDHHPALHTQVVAKPLIDLAAALLARAPPVIPVVVAFFRAPTPVAPATRPSSALNPPNTQPRAPPLG